MKRVFYFGALAVLSLLASCSNLPGGGSVKLTNATDSVSAALGFMEAKQLDGMMDQVPFDGVDLSEAAKLFAQAEIDTQYVAWRKNQFGDLNVAVFKAAYLNQLAGKEGAFNDNSANAFLQAQFQKHQEVKQAEASERTSGAGDKGRAFLEENGTRPEVTVLPSGLQYEVLTEGSGAKPGPSDRVRCHYHGTLIDGTVFDSSVNRGEPAVFGVGQVIKGWTEALQLMPVGSKWRLYLPSELAYGQQGAGGAIGPNETLIFEVELLGIE